MRLWFKSSPMDHSVMDKMHLIIAGSEMLLNLKSAAAHPVPRQKLVDSHDAAP